MTGHRMQDDLDWTTGQLSARVDSGSDDALGLPGVETVLTFLALKFVVPVAASFVSRLAYDKYKNIRTAKDAEEALLGLEQAAFDVRQIDEAEVLDHLAAVAAAEGIAEADARRIGRGLIARLSASS